MNRIWHELVDSLGGILRLLRLGRLQTAPVGADCETVVEPAWDRCEAVLGSVLVPTDEYAYLKSRIQNGKQYYAEGEDGAASYEVGLALRRACKLHLLYG